MGRFFAIVLVVTAACGTDISMPQAGGPGGDPGAPGTPAAPLVAGPSVCGSLTWSSSLDPATPMQLAVSASGGTFELVVTPTKGGTLTGLAVVDGGKITAETALPITQSFTSSSLSRLGPELVAASHDGDSIVVSRVSPDLTTAKQFATLDGTLVAASSLVTIDNVPALAYANGSGVWMQQLGAQDTLGDNLQLVATDALDPITSVMATQLGEAAYVGWSSAGGCGLAKLYALESWRPAVVEQAAITCGSPRIAANTATGSTTIVYETSEGVRMMSGSNPSLQGAAQLVGAGAVAPRVVFDGQYTWVSYLDTRGMIVVGVVNPSGKIVTAPLDSVRPGRDSYELAMFDGAPWVFAFDANGYTANRLCVVER